MLLLLKLPNYPYVKVIFEDSKVDYITIGDYNYLRTTDAISNVTSHNLAYSLSLSTRLDEEVKFVDTALNLVTISEHEIVDKELVFNTKITALSSKFT